MLHKWQSDEEIMQPARSFPDHVTSKEALVGEFEKELNGEETGRTAYIIEERVTGRPGVGPPFGFTGSDEVDRGRCRTSSR